MQFSDSQQRENLEMLAAYLASGRTRMEFNMRRVCTGGTPNSPECGTVGCALGHTPDATGVRAESDVSWITYGLDVVGTLSGFMFGGCWQELGESTPEQAADRIAYFLDYGEPGRVSWEEIARSESPQDRPWAGYFYRSGRVSAGDILGRLPSNAADLDHLRTAIKEGSNA